MKLPKLKNPIFDLTLPSNKQVLNYHPYTVEEEKILLLAKESKEPKQFIQAIRQVVNNCIIDDIDVNSLAVFDLEWIYLQLRIKSVSDFASIFIIDADDNKKYEFEIDLEQLKITDLQPNKEKIDLGDGIGIIMKYPTYELLDFIQTITFNDVDDLFEIIYQCIDMIYDEDSVYPIADLDKKELQEWFSTMNSKKFSQIVEFFEDMPKLQYKIEYTNSEGTKKEVLLQGVSDFFI